MSKVNPFRLTRLERELTRRVYKVAKSNRHAKKLMKNLFYLIKAKLFR